MSGTSIGVVVGLGLVVLTGIEWIDPLLALIVGALILKTGWRIVDSLVQRPDGSCPSRRRAGSDSRGDSRAIFQPVRRFTCFARGGPARRFAEFHLLVDGDLTVRAAHHIAHEVEAALVADMPGLEVTIHIEPVDEQNSWESEEMKRLGEAVSGDSINPS